MFTLFNVPHPLAVTPYRVISGNLNFIDQRSDGTAQAQIQNGAWSYMLDVDTADLTAQFTEFAGRDVVITMAISNRVFVPTSVRLTDQTYGNRR